jgi:epoxyqueuosine reductase
MSVDKFKDYGLNIFATCPVQQLPAELRNYLPSDSHNTDATLCIAASGGKALWEKLNHPLTGQNPIDDFSSEVVRAFFPDAVILFPDNNSNSILPLQKMARALNISRQSRLGIDIHQDFGLWFAFRCVFITHQKIPQIMAADFESPCNSCLDKPCLKETDFHKARLRCPFKSENQYTDEQLKYHFSKQPT